MRFYLAATDAVLLAPAVTACCMLCAAVGCVRRCCCWQGRSLVLAESCAAECWAVCWRPVQKGKQVGRLEE
jgi:hypothetical protein